MWKECAREMLAVRSQQRDYHRRNWLPIVLVLGLGDFESVVAQSGKPKTFVRAEPYVVNGLRHAGSLVKNAFSINNVFPFHRSHKL